jgi:hypothetical protein
MMEIRKGVAEDIPAILKVANETVAEDRWITRAERRGLGPYWDGSRMWIRFNVKAELQSFL